jgi:hypothetical protein
LAILKLILQSTVLSAVSQRHDTYETSNTVLLSYKSF